MNKYIYINEGGVTMKKITALLLIAIMLFVSIPTFIFAADFVAKTFSSNKVSQIPTNIIPLGSNNLLSVTKGGSGGDYDNVYVSSSGISMSYEKTDRSVVVATKKPTAAKTLQGSSTAPLAELTYSSGDKTIAVQVIKITFGAPKSDVTNTSSKVAILKVSKKQLWVGHSTDSGTSEAHQKVNGYPGSVVVQLRIVISGNVDLGTLIYGASDIDQVNSWSGAHEGITFGEQFGQGTVWKGTSLSRDGRKYYIASNDTMDGNNSWFKGGVIGSKLSSSTFIVNHRVGGQMETQIAIYTDYYDELVNDPTPTPPPTPPEPPSPTTVSYTVNHHYENPGSTETINSITYTAYLGQNVNVELKPVDGYTTPKQIVTQLTGNNQVFDYYYHPLLYSIKTSIGPGDGTITPSIEQINWNSNKTITCSCDANNYISKVLVDDVVVYKLSEDAYLNTYSYEFKNIKQNHTVKAYFGTMPTHSIITSKSGDGEITQSQYDIEHGSNRTISFEPSEHSKIEELIIDGVNVSISDNATSYTFENISGNHTIHVKFAATEYLVATYIDYGTIDSSSYVTKNEDITIRYLPAITRSVKTILINGEPITADASVSYEPNTIILHNVQKNMSVGVFCEAVPFLNVKTNIESGEITEDMTVLRGGSCTIEYRPDNGYKVDAVLVNGVDFTHKTNENTIRLTNIHENKEVNVLCSEIPRFSVSTHILNGTITESTDVSAGSSVLIEFNPIDNYKIASVIVNNENKEFELSGDGGSLYLENIREDKDVFVICEQKRYAIYTDVKNGKISGDLEVSEGEDAIVLYSTNKRYRLRSITIDGKKIKDLEKHKKRYVFKNVTEDHNIKVVYKKIKPFIGPVTGDPSLIDMYILIFCVAALGLILTVKLLYKDNNE